MRGDEESTLNLAIARMEEIRSPANVTPPPDRGIAPPVEGFLLLWSYKLATGLHILILTNPEDYHAFAVSEGLRRKGVSHLLWQIPDFPSRQKASVWFSADQISWELNWPGSFPKGCAEAKRSLVAAPGPTSSS